MKKKSIFTIFSILFSLVLTGCSISINDNKVETNNNVITEQAETTVTMRDIANFLQTKKAHYPLSDEFVERYQQDGDGYIVNAKKAGLIVDRYQHEPNQKWHFFDSWLYPSIEEGTITWEADAKSRVYTNLKCPELLLWIYEACDVNPVKVKQAKEAAEKAKVEKLSSATLAKNMRACVSWDDVKGSILNFMNDSSKVYPVKVNEGAGYSITGLKSEYNVGSIVTFSVDVTDSTKSLDEVKMNDTVLTPTNGNTYSFTMPSSEVTISITLKDKKPATNVNLDVDNFELNVGKNKTIIASVQPSDTTDVPTWSIVEGDDLINITPDFNKVKITAIKEGLAKVKVSYNENVKAICSITINKSEVEITEGSVAKYDIKYDLGSSTRSKALNNASEVKDVFELTSTGSNIINSVDAFENLYGGGYGTGTNAWHSGDILKFGTTSVNGSLTLDLTNQVNCIKITGYVYATSCKVQVGDSSSSDWEEGTNTDTSIYTCLDMTVAGKDTVENNQTSTITINFEATSNLKIVTTNKKPLFITAIEFIYNK